MGTDAPLVDISEDKLVQFETEVRMIPQFDPENPRMISQGPEELNILVGVDHKDYANAVRVLYNAFVK